MGLVEPVNLIDEQHRTRASLIAAHRGFRHGLAQILHPRHHRGQRDKIRARLRRQQTPQRGLAGPGWPPQDQGRQILGVQNPAEKLSRSEHMCLADELSQGSRTHALRQRLTAPVTDCRPGEQVHEASPYLSYGLSTIARSAARSNGFSSRRLRTVARKSVARGVNAPPVMKTKRRSRPGRFCAARA